MSESAIEPRSASSASMVVSSNPLVPPRAPIRIPAGVRCIDIAPESKLPLLLRLNGEWRLRADWELVVQEGDVVEWHCVPQGGSTSRGLLQVVLLVVAVVYAYYSGDVAGAAQIYALGSAALSVFNLLVPLKQPNRAGAASPASVYNVQLAGNQARLNEPIPVIYGRMLVYPDFASQPYGEYQNNDQTYFALLCIGQGNFTIERLGIANSPLSSFSDVSYNVLAPGTAPSIVLPNVVNSPEAAGQEIKEAPTVGPYAVCGPGFKAAAVGIDIIFNSGLVKINNSGVHSPVTVTFRFEAQEIDDLGVPVGDWFVLGNESITRQTVTPVRVSFKYPLPAAARVQVRFTRTSTFMDSVQVQNSPSLGGVRAYLSNAAPLSSTATHLEIRIRASEQLTQFSQSRISAIVRRKLRTWSPAGGGTWGPEIETRSIAWALADLWTNDIYGDGLHEERVDLQTLYDLDRIWTARQDRLDIGFDSKITSWDAATTIAQAGRARPFRRAGVNTLFRDQRQTLPVTAFTSRNMVPGLDIGYSLATEITADGVIVEYFGNRSWSWESVTCPAPGVVVTTNAPRVRLMGITGRYHARREGLYQAAQNVYRRKLPKWQTELTGMLPAYGSLVLYAPDLPGYGQAGDVAFWDEPTLVMGLSEPAVFTPGASGHYISLTRDDGSVTPAIACTPGPTPNDVVLAIVPDFALVLDSGMRERPKYIFGAAGQHRVPVLVLGIQKRGKDKSGAQLIEITGVAENDAIHDVDVSLLPGPGDVQDPVGSGVVPSMLSFSAVVNVNAVSNAGTSSAIGVSLTGLNPAWVLQLSMPASLTFSGWSPWSNDYSAGVPSPPTAWGNHFKVTNGAGSTSTFGANAIVNTPAAAAAAFTPVTVTGSSSYVFWIEDTAGNGDNRGGLSILVTKV